MPGRRSTHVRMRRAEHAQVHFNFLVDPSCFAISLGVVGRTHLGFDPQDAAHFLEDLQRELRALIRNHTVP